MLLAAACVCVCITHHIYINACVQCVRGPPAIKYCCGRSVCQQWCKRDQTRLFIYLSIYPIYLSIDGEIDRCEWIEIEHTQRATTTRGRTLTRGGTCIYIYTYIRRAVPTQKQKDMHWIHHDQPTNQPTNDTHIQSIIPASSRATAPAEFKHINKRRKRNQQGFP